MVAMMFALVDYCIIQYGYGAAHIILIYYTVTLVFATCARINEPLPRERRAHLHAQTPLRSGIISWGEKRHSLHCEQSTLTERERRKEKAIMILHNVRLQRRRITIQANCIPWYLFFSGYRLTRDEHLDNQLLLTKRVNKLAAVHFGVQQNVCV